MSHQSMKVRHILSLSGGKDSAALAIYMRDRVPEMEYVFHDTDMELPETYDYLARLEALLGRQIQRSKAALGFDHWHRTYGYMLPSQQRRWCTKMLKLKPFEAFCGEDLVYNYIGLRADEKRAGFLSSKENIKSVYPFREDGLVKADVFRILEESGLGLPKYTDWGRTRSGCFFCFFQQKIEWVRLLETYPERFEEAKRYEEMSVVNGEPFFWNQTESLAELQKPERIAEIKANAEKRAQRVAAKRNLPLMEVFGAVDNTLDEDDGCLACHV
jgi:3'-phosphoadenosine 5'-phosphosulfate sulfotransferase (PAPS reductase)/FAD synthetase